MSNIETKYSPLYNASASMHDSWADKSTIVIVKPALNSLAFSIEDLCREIVKDYKAEISKLQKRVEELESKQIKFRTTDLGEDIDLKRR